MGKGMWDCVAEKEKGSWKKNVDEKEPGKNRSSISRETNRGRWKEDEARTRGAPAALPRFGESLLVRSSSARPSRPRHARYNKPHQFLIEATGSSDATSTSRGHGRRGRRRGGNTGRGEAPDTTCACRFVRQVPRLHQSAIKTTVPVSPSKDDNNILQKDVTRACPICLRQSTCYFPIILSLALSSRFSACN